MVKHPQTIRRLLPTNCLSVFDHFVRLALKGLRRRKSIKSFIFHDIKTFRLLFFLFSFSALAAPTSITLSSQPINIPIPLLLHKTWSKCAGYLKIDIHIGHSYMRHNISGKKSTESYSKKWQCQQFFAKVGEKSNLDSPAKPESMHYQYRIKGSSFAKQTTKMS